MLRLHAGFLLCLFACAAPFEVASDTMPGPYARVAAGPALAPFESGSFSFLVGGHMYGDPGAEIGIAPSPTFTHALQDIREGDDHFIVSTGDLMRAYHDAMWVATDEIFQFCERPLFHAPGNHDYLADKYESRLGSSYGNYRYGNSVLVLLNTELETWNISGDQLEFLRRTVEWVSHEPSIENVFVFGHKVLFAAEEPRYAALFRNCNGRDGWQGKTNFNADVAPLLKRLAATKHVTWFAGDVGVLWSFSLFHDVNPELGVRFVAAGLGSTERDCMVRVHVVPGAEPRLETVPLSAGSTHATGDPIGPDIRAYGPEHWEAHFRSRHQ